MGELVVLGLEVQDLLGTQEALGVDADRVDQLPARVGLGGQVEAARGVERGPGRVGLVPIEDHELVSYWWGAELLSWLERLEREQANFRAALTFSLERGDAEAGLRLAAGNWVLWGFRGPWQEGRDWIERLLAFPDANTPSAARADALTVVGQLAFSRAITRALKSISLRLWACSAVSAIHAG